MLTILLGTDWVENRKRVLQMIADDVRNQHDACILIVPEMISHDVERRLCEAAGDTTSRYAEVLSFTRLCRRVSEAVGRGIPDCLDNGGRVVAMASAARQLHSKLKAYAAVETRPDFLDSLVTAIDEFKRCCITADDLASAAKKSDGVLAQKLEELSLLMFAYDGLCENGRKDPSSQMMWLLEQLEDSNYAQDHTFYIDGFPDFTRQHMAIVEHIILNSHNVVISLNCDRIESDDPAFEKVSDTAQAIVRFAQNAGIDYNVVTITPRSDPLKKVRDTVFRGKIERSDSLDNCLQLEQFRTIYEECLAAAKTVMYYVQKGDRYRDFSVVCTDMQAYRNTLELVFERCNIPVYLSGTEDILEKSVISTVLYALDTAMNGFEQRDVFRYIKSVLSPLDLDTCNLVENYCILWNISGNLWTKEWVNHPSGLGAEWSETDRELMDKLNAARNLVMDPLMFLHNAFNKALTVQEQVDAILTFLDKIELSKQLEQLANSFESIGDFRNSQILDQLWEILLSALSQLQDVLGDTVWSSDAFTRLLRLLLSQYDVGTIPHVLDAVMVGPMNAMRCQQVKHVIILGALEGQLPGYTGSMGILSDSERTELRRLGVPLTGGAMEGVQAEFSDIYGVFCGAEETVHVFCPSGPQSFIFKRLINWVDGPTETDVSFVTAMADPLEAGAYLLRMGTEEDAVEMEIQNQYLQIQSKVNHALGQIDKTNVDSLYGKSLYLSASQVDKQADCRLSYFLRYGLNAKERKPITIDPAEFGTYVHAVLEETAKEIVSLGGFRNISLEQTLEIAQKHSKAYASARFNQIESKRLEYLFKRNTEELRYIVEELWQELQQSEFSPIGFEVAFGDGREIPAIPIPGKTMSAKLRGFVDRVDIWNSNGNNYFRVVDYKTGRKDFDYCDVFNGYGLQMLLYLFALEEQGVSLLGDHPKGVGIQYFPARIPFISASKQLSPEEALQERRKQLKRKGLLLNDEEILSAMEPGENFERLNCVRKKDGSLSGDIATREQMHLLKKYVFSILGNLVDDISGGCITPNPYTRGSSHNACAFCPYSSVCHPAFVEGRRNYQAMNAQHFWDEVKEEVEKHGR